MKKLLLILLCVPLIFNSCSVVFPVTYTQITKKNYMTHYDVMDSYKTKRDVIRKFGKPTEKDIYEGVEIWYYNYGSVKTTKKKTSGNENTDVNFDSRNTDIDIDTDYLEKSTKRTSSYKKYVEFQFEDGEELHWRSNGVDYGKPSKEKRKDNITKTSMIGLLIDFGIWMLTVGVDL